MRSSEAFRLTAVEAATAIENGQLDPIELVESCLYRAHAREADVKAWQYLAANEATMEVRLRRAGGKTGSLWSIPFGVKDIMDVAALPTGFGTPIYHGHVSQRSAACVMLLQEAGAVCLGKTVTTELAHFHPGKTRNPQRLACTPGGSSSGSAAAVASGSVPIALGTQTTGSVLRPAAFCGVFGFKPSFGDIGRSGVMECASSFDTVGWFARCVADLEMVRCGLLRTPIQPLRKVDVSGLRCGVFRSPDWQMADESTRDAIDKTAEILAAAGARVRQVDPPAGYADIAAHHRTIAGFEFARAISWERIERGSRLSPKLLDGRCADGLQTTYTEYVNSQDALLSARAAFAELIDDYDVLVTPVAPGAAPEGLASTGDPVFNTAWTALHVPAVSLPAFSDPTGMPIGVQLIGAYRQDSRLLAAAAAIARALGVERVEPAD